MTQFDGKISKEQFQPANIDSSQAEKISKPSLNYWQDAWLRVRKNKGAIVSLVVILLLTILALAGPSISKYEFDKQNTKHANLPDRKSVV